MLRSAFGVIALVLLGFAVFVQLGARAEVTVVEVDRSTESASSDNLAVAGRAAGILGAGEVGGESARPRRFGSESGTLLLLGAALFGAAHYARRPARTHR